MGNRLASHRDREIYGICISGSEKVRHRMKRRRFPCKACRTSMNGCPKHRTKNNKTDNASTTQSNLYTPTIPTLVDPMRGYTLSNGNLHHHSLSNGDARHHPIRNGHVSNNTSSNHEQTADSHVNHINGRLHSNGGIPNQNDQQCQQCQQLGGINTRRQSSTCSETNPDISIEYTDLPETTEESETLETEVGPGQPADRDKDYWLHYSYPQDNLVLSGGGSKGYSFVGSLKALEDCGVLGKVKRVAGSSVGSICAGLIAVGCSPQEIADVFALDVKWLFHDQSCQYCFCVPNIVKKFGVHPARRFYDIYGSSIASKYDNPDLTFKQLYDLSGRELCIVVTNLTRMCSEYCHYKTTPDLPIRLAVRMSMAFPIVYQPVQHSMDGTTCLYTDGGALDQYPVHCFDDGKLDVNENQTSANLATLGLYVISECAIDYKIWQSIFNREIPYKPSYVPDTKLARARLKERHPTFKSRKRREEEGSKLQQRLRHLAASVESLFKWPEEMTQINIKTFADFMSTTLETVLANQRKLTVKPSDVDRTIPINCGYIGTNDYIIEPGDREFMIKQGYECTRQFLLDFIKKEEVKAAQTPSTPEREVVAHHEISLTNHERSSSTVTNQLAGHSQVRTIIRSASRETQV